MTSDEWINQICSTVFSATLAEVFTDSLHNTSKRIKG